MIQFLSQFQQNDINSSLGPKKPPYFHPSNWIPSQVATLLNTPYPLIELYPSVSYAWNHGFRLLFFNLIFGDLDISWQPYKHKNQIMQQPKKKSWFWFRFYI